MEKLLEKPRTAHQSGTAPTPRTVRRAGAEWFRVCELRDLEDSWGEAALVNGHQLALFRVGDRDVFAVAHADPATRSHVMARGMVGLRGITHTIASPLHKEVYSLATGECFGNPALRLGTYPVRVVDGAVEVSL